MPDETRTSVPSTTRAPSQEVVSRTKSERAIEDSMRQWYAMRDERDEALSRIDELERQLSQATTETSVYLTRNTDLEHKYENLLIRFTQIQSALSNVGGLADTISLSVSEVLSLSRTRLPPPTNRSDDSEGHVRREGSEPSPSTSPQIRDTLKALDELTTVLDAKDQAREAEEDEKLKGLARRLSPESEPPIVDERRKPSWLSSNSQSPKP